MASSYRKTGIIRANAAQPAAITDPPIQYRQRIVNREFSSQERPRNHNFVYSPA
jgi:hypothetical protein